MIHTENRSGLTAISETIFCTGFANFPPRIDGFSHYWQIRNLHISVCKTRIRGNPVVHKKRGRGIYNIGLAAGIYAIHEGCILAFHLFTKDIVLNIVYLFL